MQSLRAVGYTTPAAVADLVDNSIAAAARQGPIRFTAAPEPLVVVVDDGEGIEPVQLDGFGLPAATAAGGRAVAIKHRPSFLFAQYSVHCRLDKPQPVVRRNAALPTISHTSGIAIATCPD